MRRTTFLAGIVLALVFILSAAGCSGGGDSAAASAAGFDLQQRLLDARPGDVIEIPAGRYDYQRGLTLNVDGVTLRGAGMDQTVLSFKDQVAGAAGLLVTANDFTIEDLAIEDTKGDGLKITKGQHIVIRRVRTEWTRGPHTENGAYGIYPVQTEHTLIEESVAIGASDAGIYVGQSRNVIVRGNRAEYNVAGIEVENTVGADVYGNTAINNTGGILVFNMPDLPMEGHSTRVFNNVISHNNTDNFAAPGTAVSSVPAGTGIIVNSNDFVEIFDNDIAHNRTGNVLISSYYSVGYAPRDMAEVFDPYPEGIYVYGNRFEGGGDAPVRPELEQLRAALFGADGRLPDIIWDGIVNAARDGGAPPLCVDNDDAIVLNMDAGNEGANPGVSMDAHRCSQEKLAAVRLPMNVD
jgi:parallel beta-helix repeat protein